MNSDLNIWRSAARGIPRAAVASAILFFFSCAGADRGGVAPSAAPEIERPVKKAAVGGAPEVRVLLLETDEKISVSLPGGEVEARARDGQNLGRFEVSGTLAISKRGDGIRLKQRARPVYEAPVMEIRPADGAFFEIDGSPYRGRLLLVRNSGSSIMAINLIAIDDYLKGVLPAEIGYLKEGQYEAYKVQAIASRSYALSKLEEKIRDPYDLKATIMDQVYKGIRGENRSASEAVERTRGVVGIWEGRPIKAYYSSCCGGHTADIRVGWPWKSPYPYLYGRRDCAGEEGRSFCRDSGHFRWTVTWSGSDLARITSRTLQAELGGRVAPFNIIRDIRVESYARSGRATAVSIVTDKGTYRIDGDRVRWVLRPNSPTGPILRSTLFKLEVDRSGGRVTKVHMKGGGNGHGVGMCQAGAIRMASEGFSAENILLHYYPGISIEKIY